MGRQTNGRGIGKMCILYGETKIPRLVGMSMVGFDTLMESM
jgi:hypothetical protein